MSSGDDHTYLRDVQYKDSREPRQPREPARDDVLEAGCGNGLIWPAISDQGHRGVHGEASPELTTSRGNYPAVT